MPIRVDEINAWATQALRGEHSGRTARGRRSAIPRAQVDEPRILGITRGQRVQLIPFDHERQKMIRQSREATFGGHDNPRLRLQQDIQILRAATLGGD